MTPISTLRSGTGPTHIKREPQMGFASYEIVGDAGEWRVGHDGKAENVYETKEAASRRDQLAAWITSHYQVQPQST